MRIRICLQKNWKLFSAFDNFATVFSGSCRLELLLHEFIKLIVRTLYCLQVRAFGALLKYLDAVRLGVEFEEYSVKTPIKAIKSFTVFVFFSTLQYYFLFFFHVFLGFRKKSENCCKIFFF